MMSKKKVILTLLGIMLFVNLISTSAFADWFYDDFNKRKSFNATNNDDSAYEKWQVSKNVSHDSDMQSDFSDIRFTWENETTGNEKSIDYWIEDKVDGSWAKVWVAPPEGDPGQNEKMYMYYGNSTVSSKSNFGKVRNNLSIGWNVTSASRRASSTATLGKYVFVGGDLSGRNKMRFEKRWRANGSLVDSYEVTFNGTNDVINDITIMNNGTKDYVYGSGYIADYFSSSSSKDEVIVKIDPDTMKNKGNWTYHNGGVERLNGIHNNGTSLFVVGRHSTNNQAILRELDGNLNEIRNKTYTAGGDERFNFVTHYSNNLSVGGHKEKNSDLVAIIQQRAFSDLNTDLEITRNTTTGTTNCCRERVFDITLNNDMIISAYDGVGNDDEGEASFMGYWKNGTERYEITDPERSMNVELFSNRSSYFLGGYRYTRGDGLKDSNVSLYNANNGTRLDNVRLGGDNAYYKISAASEDLDRGVMYLAGNTNESGTTEWFTTRVDMFTFTENEPTTTSLSLEEDKHAKIEIISPKEKIYQAQDEIDLNFSVEDPDNSTFQVNATLNGVQVYQNDSYINDTLITQRENTTLDENNFTVWVYDGVHKVSSTVIFDNFHGINVTKVQNANGTEISGWDLFANNGTKSKSFKDNSGSLLLRYSDIPNGTTNITVNYTSDFDNETKQFQVNNSMGFIEEKFDLYRFQYFQLNDDSGNTINNFNISFDNGTATLDNVTTSDGRLEASLRNIPLSLGVNKTNLTIVSEGYDRLRKKLEFNLSSTHDVTYSTTVAGLRVKVFDETSPNERLNFDINLNNGTCSKSADNIREYNKESENLCLGFNTIAITNNSHIIDSIEYTYPTRKYFVSISEIENISLDGYLLREDKGVDHQYTVTTLSGEPIENAIVTARKSINGTFIPVAQEQTDSTGSATLFLDDDITYQVVVEADGYVSETFTSSPSSQNTDTFVRLEATGEEGANIINVTTMFDSISFDLDPDQKVHTEALNISFFISDSSGSLQYFGMNVTHRNTTPDSDTTIFSKTINTSPSGGDIVFETPNKTGWYDVDVFFKKTEFDEYRHETQTYYITTGTGLPEFDPEKGIFHINTMRLFGLFALLIGTAFFVPFGFLATITAGLSIMALLTFGVGIFPATWFIATFLITISAFILLRRI